VKARRSVSSSRQRANRPTDGAGLRAPQASPHMRPVRGILVDRLQPLIPFAVPSPTRTASAAG
jgi:hypothetical protein